MTISSHIVARAHSNPFASTDLASVREVEESLVKSFAIHLAVAATFGHLMSLRNYPKNHSARMLFYLIGFFGFPMLPFAQFLRQLIFIIPLCFKRRRRGLTFYLSTCCGMYAAKSENKDVIDSRLLIQIDPDKICRKRASYNVLWVGRIIVLLAVSTQYCGVVVLWFRRAIREYDTWVWQIDNRNLQVVSGGLTAVIISLVISFLNTEWTIENQLSDNGVLLLDRSEGTTSATRDMVTPSEAAETTRDNARYELQGQLYNTSICTSVKLLCPRPLSALLCYRQPLLKALNRIRSYVSHFVWLNRAKHFYIRFRALNHRVSNICLRIFPLELQWDLELAYVLHLLTSFLILPPNGYHRVLLHNPENFFTLWRIQWDLEFTFIAIDDQHFKLLRNLYFLPFIAISLNFLHWISVTTRVTRFIPKILYKWITEIDFWLWSGHTVFSLPLMLLMFLLPLCLQIKFIQIDFREIKQTFIFMARAGWSDNGRLWKDPLEDQLFII